VHPQENRPAVAGAGYNPGPGDAALGAEPAAETGSKTEVDVFYWTVLAPDIVNPVREEQSSVSE